MQMLRKTIATLSVIGVLAACEPATMAQQATPQPTPAAAATPAGTEAAPAAPAATQADAAKPATATLKEGTEVKLKLAQGISSKTAAVGDPVELLLDEDIVVANAIVAQKGSRALAKVSDVKKAGMVGKGGALNLRLEYLKAGDTRIKLRGAQGKAGDNKTGATVGLVVAFGIVGFMKHGKQAEVKEGTPMQAFVDEDVQLAVLGPAPAAAPKSAPATK